MFHSRAVMPKLLLIRHCEATAQYPDAPLTAAGTFPGSPDDRRMLEERGSRFRARWDRAHGPYLHHQKSWLVDAGHPSEVAFVGGINLTARALGSPGHESGATAKKLRGVP